VCVCVRGREGECAGAIVGLGVKFYPPNPNPLSLAHSLTHSLSKHKKHTRTHTGLRTISI